MQQHKLVLPLELFRPILSRTAHNSSLCAASLSSSALREEAQHILFRDPHIPQGRSTAYRHLRFLETILEHPERLAKIVVRYDQWSVGTTSDSYSRGSPEEQNVAIERTTRVALRLMVNLKHLSYREYGGAPSAHILNDCSFQLQTLAWGCHADEVVMFREIFPTQPYLVDLTMNGVDIEVLMEDPYLRDGIKGLLPNLVTLTGSRGTLEAILPGRLGRPIECINWFSDNLESNEATVHHMSRELGHVRYMSMIGYFGRPDLSLLIDHLRSLELLHVIDCTEQELALLGQLPRLRHLILTIWMDITSRTEDKSLVLAGAAFSGCPHLQKIDIQHTQDQYLRYDCTASPFGSCVMKLSADKLNSPGDLSVFVWSP